MANVLARRAYLLPENVNHLVYLAENLLFFLFVFINACMRSYLSYIIRNCDYKKTKIVMSKHTIAQHQYVVQIVVIYTLIQLGNQDEIMHTLPY